MPRPGFIPTGNEFYATIARPGLEEVIQEDGVSLKFPSAAAAVSHAMKSIDRANQAELDAVRAAVQPDEKEAMVEKWRLERAEKLRLEREAFDMRNVEVITKRRRKIA